MWDVKENMPPKELAGWMAFFKMRREEEDRAFRQAEAKSQAKRGRRGR